MKERTFGPTENKVRPCPFCEKEAIFTGMSNGYAGPWLDFYHGPETGHTGFSRRLEAELRSNVK